MQRYDANKENVPANRRPFSADKVLGVRRPSVERLRERDSSVARRRISKDAAPEFGFRKHGSLLSTHLGRTDRPAGLTALDQCAATLADDVLLAMHEQELLHAVSAEKLAQNVNLEHRRKVVSWLVKAFHVVNFDDAILYGTVQLADRYLVVCGKNVSGSHLQAVVMACLCTTLKLQTADSLTYSVPTLLQHITHSQIGLERVLKVEREVLQGVQWAVTIPTIQNFLDCFSVRCIGLGVAWDGLATTAAQEAVVGGPAEVRPKFWHLADFIAQLTLLQHEYCAQPSSLLASAALVLAALALEAPSLVMTALLEDIGHIWRREEQLQPLVTDLQEGWRAAIRDPAFAAPVVDKFAERERHEVAKLPVPTQLIRVR
jgi:hypothetical protein